MTVSRYLAMTAAEIHVAQTLPPKLAYMACHFSPYGLGLSNCPEQLPPGAMLMVNDRTPISGHDPGIIAAQLSQLVDALECGSVLLDFQRPDCQETAELCAALTSTLTCPVCVSDLYAGELTCPVFLPPPALNQPLKDHLSSWAGREIWLEAALEAACITVTEQGSRYTPQAYAAPTDACFTEEALHCHYRQEVAEDKIIFHLYRSEEDLEALLEEAEALGVKKAVGLYQQLGLPVEKSETIHKDL